jgi:hypothetical protein
MSASQPLTGDDKCPDCHHQHTPTGCVGDPSPSDLWAGVDVAVCDCDDEARADWWADQ